MVPREELLSRYQTEIRPELLDPPLELPNLLKIINKYYQWVLDVEESGLDDEFSDLKMDAFGLIVEAFMKGVGNLLNEIVRV